MKKILAILLLANALQTFAQTLKTPKEFYGFQPGTKVLFHYQVVDYFKYVAATKPNQVQYSQFGSTVEGRPQIAVAVGKPEFMARLEEIRNDNLISIGLKQGSLSGKKNPAIAYLSYSVHGNEIAGTTAVSEVLYELLNLNNATTQDILENTIVIIDPALNPDGYDRYSMWYNQVSTNSIDPTPYAREHAEPWPGGRFLHYLFDPNRDWAWQVQQESENRTKHYNSWMPHLHADYHEMGPNDPYFFPPAAKPMHENITPFQRDFHVQLGEYNKKYFDKNFWLYYTKEQYDLLYPSYGDTYPTYNGAIGMTFEQGGSGVAGLAYIKRDGDTLKLTDRAAHHFAASMATLELVSDQAERLKDEFIKFHQNTAKNGIGKYKTFVLKTKNNEQKAIELANLLTKLEIKFGFANQSKNLKGFNYRTLKDESGKAELNDLIVSTQQVKGTMVKILFEPKTALEDSNTYDITTWAMPYAYGLDAFAVEENLSITTTEKMQWQPIQKTDGKPYAYVVNWNDLNAARFLAELYKNKIKVRANEQSFSIDGRDFSAGSLIITRTGNEKNENFDQVVVNSAKKHQVEIVSTTSGLVQKGFDFGSDYVYGLKSSPKVVLIGGEGVSALAFGEIWHYFEKQINYPVTIVTSDKFDRIQFNEINVLILPDGSYSKMLSEKNLEKLKTWVNGGGKLIAMEGATSAFAGKDGFGLKSKTSETPENKDRTYAGRIRESIPDFIPGAIFQLKLDASHPLAFGTNGYYAALLKETYDYDNLTEGWNVAVTTPQSYVTGFVGSRAKKKLQNTLIYGVKEMGSGSVIYMADNPVFRGFWHAGKLIFSNAIFMVK